MFRIIFLVLKSFFLTVGGILFGIIMLTLLAPALTGFLLMFILAVFMVILLLAGMALDRKLREKFEMSHAQMFSPLWTAVSIIELSLFAVFMIVINLGLISASVLAYSLIIYLILSTWILSSKIKQVAGADYLRKNLYI